MRIKYLLFTIPFLLFVSCDDDDTDPVVNAPRDTVNPIVEISQPTPDANFLLIDAINVIAKVTDNHRLEVVRVFLTDPSGARKMVHENKDIRKSSMDYNLSIHLPKDALSGSYTVMVEATDHGNNTTKDSRTITIESPALGQTEFTNAFTLGKITSALDWYGYPHSGRIELNRHWFNSSFYFLMNTDQNAMTSKAEWEKFAADFEVKDFNWSKWDENSDGQLNDAEFENAFSSLQFFEDWDTDKDGLIKKNEMANGFFLRWDQNKDGMLSREEYHEKFYTYLLDE
jgi:hypothetical protein